MQENLIINEKTVEYVDGNIKKTFTIKKQTPWNYMLTTLDLVKLVTKSCAGVPSATIKQVLHNYLQTGVSIEGATPISELKGDKIAEMGYDLIMQVIENLSENDLTKLACRVIPNITLQNGKLPIVLSVDNNDRNWNNYIEDGMTMYKLLKDSLMLEYGSFFDKGGKPQSSPENSRTIKS